MGRASIPSKATSIIQVPPWNSFKSEVASTDRAKEKVRINYAPEKKKKNPYYKTSLKDDSHFPFSKLSAYKRNKKIVPSFSPCHLMCQKHVRIYATDAIFPHSETADVVKPVL